jgi:serine/threonine-protein kinase
MPPSPGALVGPYRIVGAIGKGGMGEVYRATDTVLGRDVALKFLPEDLVRDEERLARFRREAKLLAAVNHGHIASIHGLEDGGGEPFIVLELVEGEDLAERLKRGPIPVDEAVGIAGQVAEALEEAHKKGIVHRDLKPANVKVTSEGRVKVLDFGLATAYEGEESSDDVSHSPTRSRRMTEAGLILGTAAYMSPEQARGKSVDKRADIWAFGVLLFEMLSGRRLFEGETVSDVLAAVLRQDPDWNQLPPDTPKAVRRVLGRCLEKDAARRLHDVADARLELDLSDREGDVGPAPERRRAHAGWALGTLLLGLGLGLMVRVFPKHDETLHGRFGVELPSDQALEELFQTTSFALSPNGKELVFVHSPRDHATPSQLYRRPIDSFEAEPIVGTEWAYGPFFSPDSQWLGYFDARTQRLKKIALRGGAAVDLAPVFVTARGASWGPGGIVYTSSWYSGLFRVSEDGGTPEELTHTDLQRGEKSHRFPKLLPDGSAVLYTVSDYRLDSFDDATIEAFSFKTRTRKVLVRGGSNPLYAPSGHLLFTRHGALEAVRFDAQRLELRGDPQKVLDGIVTSDATGAAQVDLAGGMLAYMPGGPEVFYTRLVWVDRNGVTSPFPLPPALYTTAHFSPDGRQLLIRKEAANAHLWVYDLSRRIMSRLTSEWDNNGETWSPDGKHVLFAQARGSREGGIRSVPSDGSSPPGTVVDNVQAGVMSVSPDGKWIAYDELGKGSGLDLWLLPLDGARTPRPFLNTRFNEGSPTFSPDGRYLAYWSDESGRIEVYLRPFPGPGGKTQISTEGGRAPVWAANGRELYYLAGNAVMAVSFTPGPVPSIGTPVRLFELEGMNVAGFAPTYTPFPDGKRFVAVPSIGARPRTIRVILGWAVEAQK